MENNNPISPHIQIYKWHISSLISISHRIIGVINILGLTLICIWITSLLLGEVNYESTKVFLNSLFGKFLILSLTWSFSFQILSEIRHLFWDFGHGFELKTSNITGLFVIFGSFILTILIYLFNKQIF
jgi:succinate dehydrogenase / fumarate reductase cytochrome b subunit